MTVSGYWTVVSVFMEKTCHVDIRILQGFPGCSPHAIRRFDGSVLPTAAIRSVVLQFFEGRLPAMLFNLRSLMSSMFSKPVWGDAYMIPTQETFSVFELAASEASSSLEETCPNSRRKRFACAPTRPYSPHSAAPHPTQHLLPCPISTSLPFSVATEKVSCFGGAPGQRPGPPWPCGVSLTNKAWLLTPSGATSLALGPLADRLNRVNLLLAVVILGSVPCALIKQLG